jgi:branched-chain amino acid transport system permease protein
MSDAPVKPTPPETPQPASNTPRLEDYAPGFARILPKGLLDGINAVFAFWSRLGFVRLIIAGLLLVSIAWLIDPSKDEVLVRTGFFALAALGLNVVVGLAGLLDLGYIAFMMIGAYTTAFLTDSSTTMHPFIASPWIALPFAVLAAMIAGLILGTPTLRLRGDYLAIVTLGFHEILLQVAKNLAVVNQSRGVVNIPHPDFHLSRGTLLIIGLVLLALAAWLALLVWRRARERVSDLVIGLLPAILTAALAVFLMLKDGITQEFNVLRPQEYWYIIVIFIVIGLFVIQRLKDSRIGRAWEAIREDEVAAAAMGIPVVRMKLYAFMIGASTSGLAGWILAVKVGFINPNTFMLILSILTLSAVVLGGVGSSFGALVGAAVVFGVPELLRSLGTEKIAGFSVLTGRIAVFGALLIVTMIFRPGGLISSTRRRAELSGGADSAEEALAARLAGEG